MYRLFREFAHRYDLHTPPGHYKHDHAFVIREALKVAPLNCQLLDVGCGTGVFLEEAIAAGIDAYGIDTAPEMTDAASKRVGKDRVRIQRMEELSGENAFDVICGLSWTIHYCETEQDLSRILLSCYDALKPGGLLILQVANDEAMNGTVVVDTEPGSAREPNDTYFIHQFRPVPGTDHRVVAHYVYASCAFGELVCEEHLLRFTHTSVISKQMIQSGFEQVVTINPTSVSPFVSGLKAPLRQFYPPIGRRE